MCLLENLFGIDGKNSIKINALLLQRNIFFFKFNKITMNKISLNIKVSRKLDRKHGKTQAFGKL